jgi:hypothetical protein
MKIINELLAIAYQNFLLVTKADEFTGQTAGKCSSQEKP